MEERLVTRPFAGGDAAGVAELLNASDSAWPGTLTGGVPFTPERALRGRGGTTPFGLPEAAGVRVDSTLVRGVYSFLSELSPEGWKGPDRYTSPDPVHIQRLLRSVGLGAGVGGERRIHSGPLRPSVWDAGEEMKLGCRFIHLSPAGSPEPWLPLGRT